MSLAGVPREGRAVALGGAVVTVEVDADAVERRLVSGQLACPGCGGVLAGWGHGRERMVRGLDGPVRGVFTVWLRVLDPDPVMPEPAGSPWADALCAIEAAAQAVARRFVLPMVSAWELAVAISGGRLLAPGWP